MEDDLFEQIPSQRRPCTLPQQMRHPGCQAQLGHPPCEVRAQLRGPIERLGHGAKMCVNIRSIGETLTLNVSSLDFRAKFSAIQREYSPQPRKFYGFCTSVTVSVNAIGTLPPPVPLSRRDISRHVMLTLSVPFLLPLLQEITTTSGILASGPYLVSSPPLALLWSWN